MSLPDFSLDIEVASAPSTDILIDLPAEHSFDSLAGDASRVIANYAISNPAAYDALRLLIFRHDTGYILDSECTGFGPVSAIDELLEESQSTIVSTKPASPSRIIVELASITAQPRPNWLPNTPVLRWLISASYQDESISTPIYGNAIIDRSGDHTKLSHLCESFLDRVFDGSLPAIQEWLSATVLEHRQLEQPGATNADNSGDSFNAAPDASQLSEQAHDTAKEPNRPRKTHWWRRTGRSPKGHPQT